MAPALEDDYVSLAQPECEIGELGFLYSIDKRFVL